MSQPCEVMRRLTLPAETLSRPLKQLVRLGGLSQVNIRMVATKQRAKPLPDPGWFDETADENDRGSGFTPPPVRDQRLVNRHVGARVERRRRPIPPIGSAVVGE